MADLLDKGKWESGETLLLEGMQDNCGGSKGDTLGWWLTAFVARDWGLNMECNRKAREEPEDDGLERVRRTVGRGR